MGEGAKDLPCSSHSCVLPGHNQSGRLSPGWVDRQSLSWGRGAPSAILMTPLELCPAAQSFRNNGWEMLPQPRDTLRSDTDIWRLELPVFLIHRVQAPRLEGRRLRSQWGWCCCLARVVEVPHSALTQRVLPPTLRSLCFLVFGHKFRATSFCLSFRFHAEKRVHVRPQQAHMLFGNCEQAG